MKEILEYQKLDNELYNAFKEINKNEDKKEAQNMVSFVKDAQSHIIYLDKQARSICEEIEKLKEVQAKGINLIEKYSKNNTANMKENELKDLQNKLYQTNKQLQDLENRLLNDENKTKQLLQDFDSTKKKLGIAKTRHQESKAKFDEYYKEKEPMINELKSKMQQMEKKIDSALINKYKALKQDGIFPVIVSLKDKRCTGCRMELSVGEYEKLQKQDYIECPSCRRILYIEK